MVADWAIVVGQFGVGDFRVSSLDAGEGLDGELEQRCEASLGRLVESDHHHGLGMLG